MTCKECRHFYHCWERRGICRSFKPSKSIEKVRQEIEMLNQKYKVTTGSEAADGTRSKVHG